MYIYTFNERRTTNIQHFSILHKFPNIKINQGKEKLTLLCLTQSDRQRLNFYAKQQKNAFLSDATGRGEETITRTRLWCLMNRRKKS